MTEFCLVYITCGSRKEAEGLANILLQQHIVACASIVPEVISRFHWQGKIEIESEVLLILKTRTDLFASLEEIVKKHHSYKVAEIIAVPIIAGSNDYLQWLADETNFL